MNAQSITQDGGIKKERTKVRWRRFIRFLREHFLHSKGGGYKEQAAEEGI